MPLLPVALYGLEVPCGDVLIPAVPDFPATFRITMAAIDPSEPADAQGIANGMRPRATLKIVRQPSGDSEDDEDSDDENAEEYMRALLGGSDSEDDSEEEAANGGPSDPAKSKKARKAAAVAQLIESLRDDADSDDEMADTPTNGSKVAKKGKGKVVKEEEESEEDSEDGDDEEIEVEEFVLCTLDPEKNFQQPLDITIAENERVFFKVSGTHTIYLTGNYVVADDHGHNHHHEVYDSEDDEEDEDYDLSPDEDELELDMDGDESDDLDALENPRVTEVESEDEAPKLVTKKEEKKGKNKRSATEIEEATSLDEVMAQSAEPTLSKKQLKKLKKNNGEGTPVKVEEAKDVTPAKGDKSDKKVQFAKNLEQGPTGSAEKAKVAAKDEKVKIVQGIKIEDKKIGTGQEAKLGQTCDMRYIGKLTDGKVFDSNKSGKPFSFKLGPDVIKGWEIGLQGMRVGGERRITCPPAKAYGSKALPGIPANSTLIFDVKLLGVKSKK